MSLISIYCCKLPFLIFGLYVSGCGTEANNDISFSGTSQEAGLDSEHINVIKTSRQAVYAATNSDLFHSSFPGGPEWNSLGLEKVMDDEWIRDFIVYSESEILGGLGPARNSDPDYFDHFIPFFYTSDGGESWEPIENEFTENNAIFNRLAATPDLDTLYALNGGNVVRSADRGRSWTPIYWWSSGGDGWVPHTNSRFIVVDQKNINNIWTGGATIALTPFLNISRDFGDSWKRVDPYQRGDADANDLVIHPFDASSAMVGLSGSVQQASAILRTSDHGETWETVFDEAAIHALESSRLKDETVYVSGRHSTDKAFISITHNFGDSWTTLIYKDGPTGIIVNDLAVAKKDDGKEIVFLGTNQGVFSYTFD